MQGLTMSMTRFFCLHELRKSDNLRMGQRFINMYIKNPWPELFYEIDNKKSVLLIQQWLSDNQYEDELPQEIKR